MRTQSGVCEQRDDHVWTAEKATICQPRRDQTYTQLDLRPLGPRSLAKLTSAVQAIQCVAHCYGGPSRGMHAQRKVYQSVQSLSHLQLFVTPWTAACQDSLSITNSRSLPKLMSIEWVMPSNHLDLCRPLLLLPSIFPSIRVFSNKSV